MDDLIDVLKGHFGPQAKETLDLTHTEFGRQVQAIGRDYARSVLAKPPRPAKMKKPPA